MSELFNQKIFNGEVFGQYVDRVPNTKLNELLRSRAVVARPDLVSAMQEQTGGNYVTTPLRGLVGGTPVNYDGITDIPADQTATYQHSRVVVGRAKAWTERDFSYDITGGVDFMENIAQQVAEYWDAIDQDTIIQTLNGVFNMTDDEGKKFIDEHTHDVTALTNTEGVVGHMDGTTMNNAMQKASGDRKGVFSLALMHSAVATHLENLKLLVYLKYNDAEGLSRDLSIGTLNGRTVLVDDSMPVKNIGTKAGVYTITIGGTPAAGNVVTVNGIATTLDSTSGASVTAAATAVKAALDGNAAFAAAYDTARNAGVITVTEKTGHYGDGAPTASVNGNATIAVATTTDPEAVPNYTTYIFGNGAIEYTDCGARVPFEMDRAPEKNGGQDTLYSRQRKCWSPYGISFTKKNMASLSPTNVELADGQNWELVNTMDAGNKLYIARKAIPIARIVSLG